MHDLTMQEAGGEMCEHEQKKEKTKDKKKMQQEGNSSTSLEGNQVALKKHKKKKTKNLEIKEVRGISDGKLETDAENDVKEAELEQHGRRDGKKKRRKYRDGDEGGNEAPKGAKNRKRKQGDDALANLKNGKRRQEDDGKIENVKTKRNKNDDKLENPKHLVVETLEVRRQMVVENEVSTNDEKLRISVHKAKRKAKRTVDACEHKENSHETCTNGRSQSLSMEVRKEVQEINEMPSTSTTINKKRKKSKEKDENAENQEAEKHSKNPLKIKGKMRKPIQTVEAEGNKETSSVRKEDATNDSVACSLKRKKSFRDGSNISSLKKKKVTFSSEIEVFTYGTDSGNEGNSEIPVIQGKRFTKEEDEKIFEAIDEYIKRNQLGEVGKSMILHFQNHSNITDFWKEIGACLPNRCREATYNRAHVLLERSQSSKLKPEEYETLFRYQQIVSPSVMKNLWSDKDDYLLVDELMKLDACCVEDVNWDNLLEHRSGDICRKRWTEMARYISENKEKPFMEQVEVLWQQYSEMMEYRK